ncbi:GNAT family N-acetyltransferase [Microcoleus vaginatus]|uniref:GNAT family N-acetyltransferase n=1 Tax=Microcoleus vaginatus TaxID=119532 RepID=UPI001688D7CC|nr:GNAT family N-acetyltransferase [Microcoleus sp. FACHB-84]
MVGQLIKYNKSIHLNQVLDIFKTEEKLLGLVPDDALQKQLDDLKNNLLNGKGEDNNNEWSIKAWVIVEGDVVIGFALAREYNRLKKTKLNCLYILKHYKGKGCGTKLMKQVKQNCKSPISLVVYEENKIAVYFYNKHEFLFTGYGGEHDRKYLVMTWHKAKS